MTHETIASPGLLDLYAGGGSDRTLPLLSTQYGMWLEAAERPDNPAMVSAAVMDLSGGVDPDALTEATRRAMVEHAGLFVGFAVRDGVPVQVLAGHQDLAVERHDLSAEQARDDAWHHARLTRGMPMGGPLVRAAVLHLADGRWQVLLEGHHLVCDGYTAGLVGTRIVQHYQAIGSGAAIPQLPSFEQLVAEDQAYLASEDFTSDERYWAELVSQHSATSSFGALGTEFPRGELRVQDRLSVDLMDRARARAKELRTSWPVLALSSVADAVSWVTGRREVALTVPASRRTSDITRGAAGMMANFLPVYVDVDPWATDPDRVTTMSRQFKSLLRHQRYPGGNVRRLAGIAATDHRPFGPTVNILGYAGTFDLGEGVRGTFRDISSGPVEDVQLTFQNRADGSLDLYSNVNPELYSRCDAEAALAAVRARFEAVADPATSGPRAIIGATGELSTSSSVPASEQENVLDAVRRWARCAPRDTAVRDAHDCLDYAELHRRSLAHASRLRAEGVGRGDLVGVVGEPDVQTVVQILAVWFAGAAYLPLSPDVPDARNTSLVGDAGVRVVLGCSGRDGWLPPGVRAVDLPEVPATDFGDDAAGPIEADEAAAGARPVDQHDLAYVIFTSGSSGRPKGVMVEWAGFTNHLHAKVDDLGLGPGDTTAMTAPLTFDISVWQMMAPLLSGGSVHVVSRTVATDPDRLGELVAAKGVTVLEMVPSLLRPAVEGWDTGRLPHPETLRVLLSTGEELPADVCTAWTATGIPAVLVNAYGPTECSDDVTHWILRPGEAAPAEIPIGRAVGGIELHVLDTALRPVPEGGQGELYVGGVAVSRGYVGLAGRTAGTFVADPFASRPGLRLYRTGDQVSRDRDGLLHFLGRVDDQVKLRGFRIELGEVEETIRGLEGVAEVAVVLAGHAEHRHLAAYVVTTTDLDAHHRDGAGGLDELARIRDALADLLPEHLIPTAWTHLDALPLTANGKVDRRRLPDEGTPARSTTLDLPRTSAEERVARVVCDLLGVDTVGRRDDFFAVGGNSLLATRLVSVLRGSIGLDVSLRGLFEARTVAALAALGSTDPASAVPAPLPAPLGVPRGPLSSGQERLWSLYQLDEKDPAYHVAVRLELDPGIDLERFREAFKTCLSRNEAPRSSIRFEGGEAVQEVLEVDALDLDWDLHDVAADDVADWERSVVRLPIDLGRGPLRVALRRVAGADEGVGRTAMVLVCHHASCDGWSLRLLLADLASAYAFPGTTATPGLQYLDYVHWQREPRVQGSAWLETQREFWAGELADAPARLAWTGGVGAADAQAGPAYAAGRRAGTLDVEVPADLAVRLDRLCAEHGLTVFTALHTALSVSLAEQTDHDGGPGLPDAPSDVELLIGTANAARPHSAFEPVVGFFANTLPLRSRISPYDSWLDLLRRHRETLLAALDHGSLPFEQIQAVAARPDPEAPLLQVMLAYQRDEVAMPGVVITALPSGSARFDLALECNQAGPGQAIRCHVEHAVDALTSERAALVVTRMVRALETMVCVPTAGPADLPRVSAEEADRLRAAGTGTAVRTGVGPAGDVVALIESGLARGADRPAVSCEGVETSYRDLAFASAAWARLLSRRGARADRPVAVLLPASSAWVAVLLGVLRSGAAYLCLDPAHPDVHLAGALAEVGADVVITDAEGAARLGGESFVDCRPTQQLAIASEEVLHELATSSTTELDADDRSPIDPQQLAYLIYTSGTTGRPKAAAVTHAGLHDLVRRETDRLAEGVVVAQFAGVGFDAAVWEVCTAISAVAHLVIPTAEERAPGEPLHRFLVGSGAGLVCLPPTVLATLPVIERPELEILVAGESCPPALADRWSGHTRLRNAYGPCEATVCATMSEPLAPGQEIVIGTPLPHVAAYVLDPMLRLVPVGETGELYLGGRALARGYWGRSALTAARFVADPFGAPGGRLYRTGDLVSWTKDDRLRFHGRGDTLVKVRGVRVDPEHVRTALVAMPFVSDAVVVARRQEGGDVRLTAYAVYLQGLPIDSGQVLDMLREVLPAQAVPHQIVTLPALPRTPNQKVDLSALPDPRPAGVPTRPASAEDPAPASPGGGANDGDHTARLIAELMGQVLGRSRLGPDEDFLRCGGDSILSVRVVGLAREHGLILSAANVQRLRTPVAVAGSSRVDSDAGLGAAAAAAQASGVAVLPPVGQWLARRDDPVDGFTQSVLLGLTPGLVLTSVLAAVEQAIVRHPVLGARLDRTDERWRLVLPDPDARAHPVVWVEPSVAGLHLVSADPGSWTAPVLRPEEGVMVRAAVFQDPDGSPLALGLQVHHLVIDGYSWRLLLEDLVRRLSVGPGPEIELPTTSTSYAAWTRWLWDRADEPRLEHQADLWRTLLASGPGAFTGVALDPGADLGASASRTDQVLEGPGLDRLLAASDGAGAALETILLAAYADSLASWRVDRGLSSDLLIRVEGHGRDTGDDGPDLSGTVGWCTSEAPVRLTPDPGLVGGDPGAMLEALQHQRSPQAAALDYGLLRYREHADDALREAAEPDVAFNFLGRVIAPVPGSGVTILSPVVGAWDADAALPHAVELNALLEVTEDQVRLRLTWVRAARLLDAADVEVLGSRMADALWRLADRPIPPARTNSATNATAAVAAARGIDL